MARGWESKDVENRQEDQDRQTRIKRNLDDRSPPPTPVEIARLAQVERTLMDRGRVLSELNSTRHEDRRSMLTESLAFLDKRLEDLEKARDTPPQSVNQPPVDIP